MIHIGIIGYGAFGSKLCEKFTLNERITVKAVCDLSRTGLKLQDDGVLCTTDFREIIAATEIDAVAIATPASTHFEIALAAIQAKKHIWVEKPIATSTAQAELLCEVAAKYNRILFVDHTPIYGAVPARIRELVAGKDLGQVRSWHATRVNLGRFQRDVNVFWDLAIHDLSTLEYVLGPCVQAVSATGISNIPEFPESNGTITCFLDNGQATIHVSWFSPKLIRRTMIMGDRRMVVWDDCPNNKQLLLCNCGVTFHTNSLSDLPLLYRKEGDFPISLPETDALGKAISQFTTCIESETTPLTDGIFGGRLVRILEAADRSMAQQGVPEQV